MGTVLLEDTSRRKLTELVSHHVFSNEDRIENLAVVHEEGLTDKFRSDCGAAGPSLDWPLNSRIVDFVDLFEEVLLDERPLFERSAHTV